MILRIDAEELDALLADAPSGAAEACDGLQPGIVRRRLARPSSAPTRCRRRVTVRGATRISLRKLWVVSRDDTSRPWTTAAIMINTAARSSGCSR